MKKGLLIALLIISTTAWSQIKPHIGVNWSQLSTEPQDFKQEGRAGMQLGVGWKFGEDFYFEPAVQWAFIGTKLVHSTEPSNDVESTVNIFRIPVMLGYDFMDKDAFFNFRLFTGPSAAFVLSTTGPNALTKEDYASTIWGWDFGTGVDISFLYLELSYELGLTPVFANTSVLGDAKNNAFLLTLGANF
ncbi:MAG: PorT family protein [Schleiferiaceae bacterium]|jgi:hypothetical protein|nr:PorT family protein [Schleiferiaceae bacterium]